ncbi:AAA family ATPase [Actinoallomurus iriomotensis]|uniref:GTPase subunit of restriction endonuclease n=1 Tax=Actinoallomurus iriomotensis TaxID=478107 RepID=A0A9W6VUT9_9ACTN|nr:AAA family ATPase [Actinoallomurus iriomotensis]GLY85973.1 GTPase subunit of restriction endonuclease [Actinoallomurus iriomotensis]
MSDFRSVQRSRLRYALEILAEVPGGMRGRELWSKAVERFPLVGGEDRQEGAGGISRGQNDFNWQTVAFPKAGWVVKAGEWTITGLGRRALELYSDPDQFYTASAQGYAYWNDHKDRFARAQALIEAIPEGDWVAAEDLAELVGLDPDRLVAWLQGVRPQGWHRVVDSDGGPPLAASLSEDERASWLALLSSDGINTVHGRADHNNRIPGADLPQFVSEQPGGDEPLRQAWLIRGSSVQGVNLVRKLWLPQGVCSLPATRLRRDLPGGSSRESIKAAIDDDYASASSNERARLVAAYHAFLSRMRAGDLVVTNDGNDLFIGTVTGTPGFVTSAERRANLQRTVSWRNTDQPHVFDDLPIEIYNRVSNPDDEVIDLSEFVGDLEQLLGEEPEQPVTPSSFELPDADDEIADKLLVDRQWLQEIIELIRDRPQLIFYGPPGTGKTYLALELAGYLTRGNPESVQLVQFHPSYSYEDFFEGYRPRTNDSDQVNFELVRGPLRRLADAAQARPDRPYVLVIDEINRGFLAKIFGELYFLLEYRKRSVNLLYGSDKGNGFSLPPNLIIVGTMNTADRTIALVDVAMRRRFWFTELHPDEAPTRDLLSRWLKKNSIEDAEPAQLLAELNSRIEDRDFRIGPSYLMRESLYGDRLGLDAMWRAQILPLLEEHYYGSLTRDEVARKFGLTALRRRIAGESSAEVPPA